MKAIGVVQLLQKKFTFLDIPAEWKGIMGNLPKTFIGIIWGTSGNGKTEFSIRFAKMLTAFGKVAWISYEQGHGADLQMAAIRNHLSQENGRFIPVDPLANRKGDTKHIDDLMAYLGKRGSPDFVFIDSIDYTDLTKADYKKLKEKFGKRKAIIFISHSQGVRPKTQIAEAIASDGQFGFYVKNFIVRPDKNRLGGIEDYIVWEQEARKREPLYFAAREGQSKPPKK